MHGLQACLGSTWKYSHGGVPDELVVWFGRADVTAKGESVANLADILGTVAGIMLSRSGLPLGQSFCLLSIGEKGKP